MGKGDKRSTRGKIFRKSYGNSRPHRVGAAKRAAKKSAAKKASK